VGERIPERSEKKEPRLSVILQHVGRWGKTGGENLVLQNGSRYGDRAKASKEATRLWLEFSQKRREAGASCHPEGRGKKCSENQKNGGETLQPSHLVGEKNSLRLLEQCPGDRGEGKQKN